MCSAICLSLTCRQFYTWFKTTHPEPLKLCFIMHMSPCRHATPSNASFDCRWPTCPPLAYILKAWMAPDYHLNIYNHGEGDQFLKTSVYGKDTIEQQKQYSLSSWNTDSQSTKTQLLSERYIDWADSERRNRVEMFELFTPGVPLERILPSPFNLGEDWYLLAWEIIRQKLYTTKNLAAEIKFWSSFNIIRRRRVNFDEMVAQVRWDIGLEAMKLLEL